MRQRVCALGNVELRTRCRGNALVTCVDSSTITGLTCEGANGIETPWAIASMADLAFTGTRGDRPPDFEQRLQMGLDMGQLAAQDAAVHKLMAEVTSLLKPRSIYQDPALMERVQEVMATG